MNKININIIKINFKKYFNDFIVITTPLHICSYIVIIVLLLLLLLLSDLGNARVIIEAVLLIETITPLLT